MFTAKESVDLLPILFSTVQSLKEIQPISFIYAQRLLTNHGNVIPFSALFSGTFVSQMKRFSGTLANVQRKPFVIQ